MATDIFGSQPDKPKPGSFLADLRKARNWIARWKAANGGFTVRVTTEGVEVQLMRAIDPDPAVDAAYSKAAAQLEQELLSAPDRQLLVSSLVRDQWAASNAKGQESAAVNDNLDEGDSPAVEP